MTELTAPEDVRVRTEDGLDWPCAVVYAGYLDDRSLHEWHVFVPDDVAERGVVAILAGLLPARTTLTVMLGIETPAWVDR